MGAVTLQRVLELLLLFRRDQVDQRNGVQLLDTGVAEQFGVELVGVHVHAIDDVGDGVARRREQQLAALGDLGVLHAQRRELAVFAPGADLAAGRQQQPRVVVGADHVAGAGAQPAQRLGPERFGGAHDAGQIARAFGEQGQRLGGRDFGVLLVRDEQVPLLVTQHVVEIAQRGDAVRAHTVTGVTKHREAAFQRSL